jgi:hypothetical protein
MPGKAVRAPNHGNTFVWSGAEGPKGATVRGTITIEDVDDQTKADKVVVNGVTCRRNLVNNSISVSVDVTFAGDDTVRHLQPMVKLPSVNNTGGSGIYEGATFRISSAVKAQLAARQNAYPIAWQPEEYKATWLVPSRMLASVYIAKPQAAWDAKVRMRIDGKTVPVSKSFNSRGVAGRTNTFLGFYVDLDPLVEDGSLKLDTNHSLDLDLPVGLAAGQFQGVFLENLETEYTAQVSACVVVE